MCAEGEAELTAAGRVCTLGPPRGQLGDGLCCLFSLHWAGCAAELAPASTLSCFFIYHNSVAPADATHLWAILLWGTPAEAGMSECHQAPSRETWDVWREWAQARRWRLCLPASSIFTEDGGEPLQVLTWKVEVSPQAAAFEEAIGLCEGETDNELLDWSPSLNPWGRSSKSCKVSGRQALFTLRARYLGEPAPPENQGRCPNCLLFGEKLGTGSSVWTVWRQAGATGMARVCQLFLPFRSGWCGCSPVCLIYRKHTATFRFPSKEIAPDIGLVCPWREVSSEGFLSPWWKGTCFTAWRISGSLMCSRKARSTGCCWEASTSGPPGRCVPPAEVRAHLPGTGMDHEWLLPLSASKLWHWPETRTHVLEAILSLSFLTVTSCRNARQWSLSDAESAFLCQLLVLLLFFLFKF